MLTGPVDEYLVLAQHTGHGLVECRKYLCIIIGVKSVKTITSWKETVGMIDAIVDSREPNSRVAWVDRYGRIKKGNLHLFDVNANSLPLIHESIIISDSEIGVQSHGYEESNNTFNSIEYLPAYRFTRAAGGLAIATVLISHDGELTIPLAPNFSSMLKPQDIIDDIHLIMCEH